LFIAAPAVKVSGVNGVIYTVEPLDACSPLRTKANDSSGVPFALVVRGTCQFDDKVRNAQDAGFKAVIVYDNEDSSVLVSSNVPFIKLLVIVFSYLLLGSVHVKDIYLGFLIHYSVNSHALTSEKIKLK
jgi:hypothetical protein